MDDGHTSMTFGHGATPTPESANDVVHCQDQSRDCKKCTKYVPNIPNPSRFDDFLPEVGTCEFDIMHL